MKARCCHKNSIAPETVENDAARMDDKAAGEREGVKTRLAFPSPAAKACQSRLLPSGARFFVKIRFHEKCGG